MATFSLDYLVDNGKLRGWETDYEPGCRLVQWLDDGYYSVLDSAGKSLSYDDTKEGAIDMARHKLTCRRRERDGVVPAKVC